jgi:predicted Zn-dependent protease with MMP-like domain
MAAALSEEEFGLVIESALATLPELFRKSIENLHIVVEDRPAAGLPPRRGVERGSILLGLYEGVPLNKRGAHYGVRPVLPDRITLFKMNLEAVSSSLPELQKNIKETLLHEIGHYFGMSEREIRAAGY